MHNFMCYFNFKNAAKLGIDYEINSLYENNFLSKEEVQSLDRNALIKFTRSDLFGRILKSEKVLREHRFSVSIPAKYIFKETKQTENIVVEGALDCAFKENGKYVIVDYKTDKTDDLSLLYEKYSRQLKIYKYALSNIEETDVFETGIYSLYGRLFLQILIHCGFYRFTHIFCAYYFYFVFLWIAKRFKIIIRNNAFFKTQTFGFLNS